ncbi:MAG: family 43 glycosylhydrolase [Clostridia bacterium]|nr:family 43 glycosylhydrolase [Clostridia bacterium]
MLRKVSYKIITLLVLLCAAAVLSISALAAEKTVYLSAAEGSDSFDGSASAPFATLKAAIEAVKDGGTVVVTDKYTVTERDTVISNIPRFVEPLHSGKITVTALTDEYDYRKDGACIYFPEEYGYDCGGDIRFENITLKSDATPIYLAGNFNSMEFGDGFDCENTEGQSKKLFVIGGYHSPASLDLPANKDVNITIDSGKFHRVICFGYQKGAGTYTFTGTANVTVNGGRIDRFYGGATLNHYSGNLNLVVNGGAFSDIYLGGDGTRRLNGNAHVELNGGNIVSTLYINNVLGDTDITLDALTLGKIAVTYGNDTIKTAAYGKQILLRYNSILHSTEFVESIEGLTDTERFGVVYVSGGADGDGMSVSSPAGDLGAAVELLANGGGDIVIVGEYTAKNFSEPTHSQPITYKGGTLNLGGAFTVGGEVAFDGIALAGNATVTGSAVTFGENTKMGGTVSVTADTVTANGGDFDTVSGGTVTLTGGSAKTVTLTGPSLLIDGANVGTVNVTSSAAEVSLLDGNIGALNVKSDSFTLRLGGGNIGTCTLDAKNSNLVTSGTTDAALVEKISPLFAKVTSENVVFVSDGGSGNGASADYALSNLADAFAALPNGGTVVICGKVTVNNTSTPAADAQYTVTSVFDGVDYRKTNGAHILFEGNLYLYSDTDFDGVDILSGKNASYLVFNGHKGVIGEDVYCTLEPNVTTYVCIVGGTRHNNYELHSANLTVNGGTWYHVYGASTAAANFPDMTASLTINGGTFRGRVCALGAGNQTGSGTLTVNGGTFYSGIYGVTSLASEVFDGKIDIVLNGGTFYGKIRVATRYETTVNGEYTVTVNGGDFAHLTDIVGGEKFGGKLVSTLTTGEDFDLGAAESGTFTYTNPIRKAADPRIALVDGMYYYMYTSSSTLSMYKAANVADLAYSTGELIFDATAAYDALDGRVHCIWPSKLEYFPAEAFGEEYEGWYLFFSTFSREIDGLSDTATDGQSRRSYVLKCTTNDLQGKWVNPVTGEEGVPEKFVSDTETFVNNIDWCAGETALRYGGEYYTLWIEQRDRGTENFRQVMYLSKMKNPWTVTGDVLELVAPEYDWEKGGYGYAENENKWYPAVIEGITPIVGDSGELFVLYACSGYWTTEYKLGQMKYLGGNLLDAASWEKSSTPIFYKNDEVNGVGGPSICTTPDGKTRYIMYHGYLGKDTSSGRYAFMEPYTVDKSGVTIGVDNHPSPLSTVFEMPLNALPLGFKISGFDNIGGTRVTLAIGENIGHVNNASKVLDAVPVIKNNRTMLPVRFVAEAFGATVAWDGATSTATLKGEDSREVSITIGASAATVNGVSVPLDSPAYIDPASNRTYLPVRAVAEALGATVFWSGDLGMAMLTK